MSLADLSEELLENGAIHDREMEVILPDGSSKVVLLSARITEIDHAVCALVSLVDITERKRAAVAVRESRTLLDKIFRASPAPIAICRLDDWRYMDVNDAMCNLVGFPHDEIIGHTPGDLDLWANEERERQLSQRLNEQDAVYDFEAEFCRSDGDTVTTLSSFQKISVEGEDCVLAVMTDITQREEKKQALIQAKERAEEIAQFRSTVLSNMTHEVRTPLTVILGFTSILREGVNEDYERFVNLIERSGRRLLLTLDSLLDLAQIEAGTLDPDMEIQSVADAVNRMMSSHADTVNEEGLSFSLTVPESHVFAEFDFELLGRVMNHLIDNAVKFTNEGSIAVRVQQEGDEVVIGVEDTGAGIDEAFQSRIFEAFSQESEGNTRSHQGSGLGLTVSKRIIECMDGELTIDSAKGRGTRVAVAFPVISVDES
jgi:PAS domain S-box-containing protein